MVQPRQVENTHTHSLGVLGLLLVLFLPLSALASQLRTYESLFTPEGRKAAGRTGTYAKDSHVWVYTSAFAKRFGMPKEWIDDSLQGAQALAYRVDYGYYAVQCSGAGDVESCRPVAACVLDMYIADEADLPWNTQQRFEARYIRRSAGFLHQQDPKDNPLYLARHTKRGNHYHLGLDAVGVFHRTGVLGSYRLAEYDRDIYAGLDYLSGTMDCGFPAKRDVSVVIATPTFYPNGSVHANASVGPDLQPINYEHKVDIPGNFMARVDAYAKAVQEPDSQWADLKQRLSMPDAEQGGEPEVVGQALDLGSSYAKDPHVWVYTSAFAKRFGMPQEWIDDSLQGAQALAYRVDYDYYGIKCGYFSELETCRPATACMLDMYIEDKADLPWNTELPLQSRRGRKSKDFLRSQDPSEKPGYLKRRTKRGNRYHLGLDAVGVFHSTGVLGSYSMAEYDRDIYAGLDYISGTMSCGFPEKREVSMVVATPTFYPSGTVHANASVGSDLKPVNYELKVDIPDSFMTRVDAYAKAVYEPNSLWAELKQRLSSSRSKAAEPKEAR